MRKLLLMGLAFGALTFSAVPASAQGAYRSPAYNNGYRAGASEGREDGREGKDYGYKRDDRYEDADDGYYRGFGSRDAYRHEFRRGYEDGYDAGYRPYGFGVRVYGGGSANEYGPYGYPERGYGAYAEWGYRNGTSVRIAFDYGRRDGWQAGFEAARRGHFEPTRHRYYRSTPGYDRRFGTRDAYDVNYRDGFRAGYDDGYRAGRRR
jgi:hypothetical protein